MGEKKGNAGNLLGNVLGMKTTYYAVRTHIQLGNGKTVHVLIIIFSSFFIIIIILGIN